jgi:alpha-1,6-mannosyltransferase
LPRRAAASAVAARPLRVADVAVWYGQRAGGITTYLDAKVAYAARTRAFDHHLVVPGRRDRTDGARHEVRALSLVSANGYRLPLRTSSLARTLLAIEPDVVLVHDRFWSLAAAGPVAADLRTPVVAVHHATADLEAASFPGPRGAYGKLFRTWERRAYERVDAVMSAAPDSGVGNRRVLPLRFGLDPAFRPHDSGRPRGDHVLYAGRISREKGLDLLLEAAAASREPWRLRVVGSGSARSWLETLVRRLGLEERVTIGDYVEDRVELARAFAEAACVVVPGSFETFGLVALEAAASGAAVVAAASTPAVVAAAPLVESFQPGSAEDLLRAIEAARRSTPDRAAAAALAARFTWERAFAAELADLEGLVG